MTKSDQRAWFADLRIQDNFWKMGYEKGHRDGRHDLIYGAIGYLLGRKSSALGHLVTMLFVVWLIMLAIHHWPVVLMAVILFAIVCYGKTHLRRPKPLPPMVHDHYDDLEEQF